MLQLDKFRRAAKHAAWYTNDTDEATYNPASYNPFRKINSRPRRIADEEDISAARIPTHRSDNDAILYQEQRRSRNYGEPPKHAHTLPPKALPSSSKPIDHGPVSDVKDMAMEPENIDHEKDNSQDSGASSAGKTSDTVIGSDSPVKLEDGKPRRRKFPFIGKKSKTGDELGDEKPRRQSSLFKKDTQKFTAVGQLRATLLNSWINILLIFVPIGIAVNYAPSVPRVGVFVINFIAIIPLAAMLSYATEEIAIRTGETIGGLLNATFG